MPSMNPDGFEVAKEGVCDGGQGRYFTFPFLPERFEHRGAFFQVQRSRFRFEQKLPGLLQTEQQENSTRNGGGQGVAVQNPVRALRKLARRCPGRELSIRQHAKLT